jgi:hypothetical protein
VRQVDTAHVAPLDAFELWPDALVRMQLRSVGRQALEVKALCRAVREALLEALTAMHGSTSPDAHQAAWDLTSQGLQKAHNISRSEGAVLAVAVELPLRREGSDGGERIACAPCAQDRGLAGRRLGAHHPRPGVDPGFVYQADRVLLGLRPLLRAGHGPWRPGALAASSRWRARRLGCCGLQRIA